MFHRALCLMREMRLILGLLVVLELILELSGAIDRPTSRLADRTEFLAESEFILDSIHTKCDSIIIRLSLTLKNLFLLEKINRSLS